MSHNNPLQQKKNSKQLFEIFSYPCFSHKFPCTGPIPGTQVTGLMVNGSLANEHLIM